jgi:hypothetical protein
MRPVACGEDRSICQPLSDVDFYFIPLCQHQGAGAHRLGSWEDEGTNTSQGDQQGLLPSGLGPRTKDVPNRDTGYSRRRSCPVITSDTQAIAAPAPSLQ